MTMTTPLTVRVELWPVAADAEGIWLLADDAWRSGPVPAEGGCHAAAEALLRAHPGRGARMPGSPSYWSPIPTPNGGSALGDVRLLHSTSWRPDEDTLIVTYLAVLGHAEDEYALDAWPVAHPVGLELAGAVGKPLHVRATDPPLPRDVDVLLHALRHLRYLMDNDAAASGALDERWRCHLADLQPTLAGMYQPG